MGKQAQYKHLAVAHLELLSVCLSSFCDTVDQRFFRHLEIQISTGVGRLIARGPSHSGSSS